MNKISNNLGFIVGLIYIVGRCLVLYVLGKPLYENEPVVTNWRDSLDNGYEKDCSPNDTPIG